jgi:hypothetical protein
MFTCIYAVSPTEAFGLIPLQDRLFDSTVKTLSYAPFSNYNTK